MTKYAEVSQIYTIRVDSNAFNFMFIAVSRPRSRRRPHACCYNAVLLFSPCLVPEDYIVY